MERFQRMIRRKQAGWVVRGILLLAIGLGLSFLMALDILPENGLLHPADNPSIFRIQELDWGGYMELRNLPVYISGYELGEGESAQVICIAERDGQWFSLLVPQAIYDQSDEYGYLPFYEGEFCLRRDRELAQEIGGILRAEFGFTEEELPDLLVEEVSFEQEWLIDRVMLLIGLLLELVGLWRILCQAEPRYSRAWRGLKAYGDPEAFSIELDSALALEPEDRVLTTGRWLFVAGKGRRLRMVPIPDVAWCHRRSVSSLTAQRKISLVLYLRSRKRPLVWKGLSTDGADQVVHAIQWMHPWMDCRYSASREQLWRHNRMAFLASLPQPQTEIPMGQGPVQWIKYSAQEEPPAGPQGGGIV